MSFATFKTLVLTLHAQGQRIGWIAQIVAKDGYGTLDVRNVILKASK